MATVNSILKSFIKYAAKLDKLATDKVEEAKLHQHHIRWHDAKSSAAVAEAARAANVAIKIKDLVGG